MKFLVRVSLIQTADVEVDTENDLAKVVEAVCEKVPRGEFTPKDLPRYGGMVKVQRLRTTKPRKP